MRRNFYNVKTTAYNTDVHSLCVCTKHFRGVTYSKGERLSVKFSFRPLTVVYIGYNSISVEDNSQIFVSKGIFGVCRFDVVVRTSL